MIIWGVKRYKNISHHVAPHISRQLIGLQKLADPYYRVTSHEVQATSVQLNTCGQIARVGYYHTNEVAIYYLDAISGRWVPS